LEEEKTFSGRGVSYCALCDGPLFKDKELFVIGGGDAAMEEANFLTKFATKVHVVHRRDKLKASKAMQDKVFANKKIEFHWDSEVAGIKGDKMVDSIIIKNSKTNKETTLPTGGIFVSIGHVPNTVLFKDKVELDKMGYIALKESMQTSVPGVFAAGDVHDPTYRQAVTAAAYGCMAALEAERFLDKDN
jgi:thioredoxin reductase (NADPH)